MGRIIMYGGTPPTISQTDRAGTGPGAAATSYPFAGRALGTAASSRLIVVGMFYVAAAARTVTCTIGGVTATEIAASAFSGGATAAKMFTAPVPTGTTGDINFTFSAPGATACHWASWAIYNLFSHTANSVAADDTHPLNMNVNTQVNSAIIGFGFLNVPHTWTGLTEEFDGLINGLQSTGASAIETVAQTPRTVTCAQTTGSGSSGNGVVGVFR